jgi:hypothetical protein
VTNTKAILDNRREINARTAYHRGIVRMIPLLFMSMLNIRPWHDQWTSTKVIDLSDEEKSKLDDSFYQKDQSIK